jgi:hypothetical protein
MSLSRETLGRAIFLNLLSQLWLTSSASARPPRSARSHQAVSTLPGRDSDEAPRRAQSVVAGLSPEILFNSITVVGRSAVLGPLRFSGERSPQLEAPRNSASGPFDRFSIAALPYLALRVDRRLGPATRFVISKTRHF